MQEHIVHDRHIVALFHLDARIVVDVANQGATYHETLNGHIRCGDHEYITLFSTIDHGFSDAQQSERPINGERAFRIGTGQYTYRVARGCRCQGRGQFLVDSVRPYGPSSSHHRPRRPQHWKQYHQAEQGPDSRHSSVNIFCTAAQSISSPGNVPRPPSDGSRGKSGHIAAHGAVQRGCVRVECGCCIDERTGMREISDIPSLHFLLHQVAVMPHERDHAFRCVEDVAAPFNGCGWRHRTWRPSRSSGNGHIHQSRT